MLPKSQFGYQNHVLILVTIFADGATLLLFAVSNEEKNAVSDNGSSKRIFNVLPKAWRVFWQKNVARIDTRILRE